MKKTDMHYLHDLVVKIDDRLDDMAQTLIKHDANLSEHMRRSEAAERGIELLRGELEPVKSHVSAIKGVGAFLGILALIATIWAAVK